MSYKVLQNLDLLKQFGGDDLVHCLQQTRFTIITVEAITGKPRTVRLLTHSSLPLFALHTIGREWGSSSHSHSSPTCYTTRLAAARRFVPLLKGNPAVFG